MASPGFSNWGALHSMEDSRGGHAKKQATKKRYHFITLGVQQARSELLRTGGRAPLAARERARGTGPCPPGKILKYRVSDMLFPAF